MIVPNDSLEDDHPGQLNHWEFNLYQGFPLQKVPAVLHDVLQLYPVRNQQKTRKSDFP